MKTTFIGGIMDHTRALSESRERAEELALYLIENQTTVRSTAERFGIRKSTVNKDVSEKLPKMNPVLYEEVHTLFEKNKSERHLRGGEATRQKYKKELNHCKLNGK